jgi:hypothetical protein
LRGFSLQDVCAQNSPAVPQKCGGSQLSSVRIPLMNVLLNLFQVLIGLNFFFLDLQQS